MGSHRQGGEVSQRCRFARARSRSQVKRSSQRAQGTVTSVVKVVPDQKCNSGVVPKAISRRGIRNPDRFIKVGYSAKIMWDRWVQGNQILMFRRFVRAT